jgi:hypothetical protein
VIAGITDGYLGSAPDMGAYEYGASNYWIAGYKAPGASTPIPPDGAVNVKLDADIMWLEGYRAASHRVYFCMNPASLTYRGEQANNIYDPAGQLVSGSTYYWRIDTVNTDGTIVTGQVFSFKTE